MKSAGNLSLFRFMAWTKTLLGHHKAKPSRHPTSPAGHESEKCSIRFSLPERWLLS